MLCWMSERSDAKKIRDALKELEPWADEEISHLERQFEERKKPVYLPYKTRCRVSFMTGILCGLVVAALTLYWLYPQFCNSQ